MQYPLNISPDRFLEAYNLDISAYVERHTFKESAQKSNKQINYMSYSHAFRLFRTYFPEFEVANVMNEDTGGFIFEEIAGRGFFLKSHVYTRSLESGVTFSSPEYYYPILTVSGLAVYPNELASKKDFKTGQYAPVEGQYVADIQLFNKSVQRSLVKAIALTTGIGLKLWTGDDLDENVLDEKFRALDHLQKLANEYNDANPGNQYEVQSTYLDTLTTVKTEGQALRRMMNSLKKDIVQVTTVEVETSVLPEAPEVKAIASSKSSK